MVAYACNTAPERLKQENSCKHELSLGYIATAWAAEREPVKGIVREALLWFIVYIYIYIPSHIYKPETCPPLGEGIQ